MAFAIALLGFHHLGSLVTPTFKKRFYLQLSISTFSKNEQKINVGSLKNFKISVHGTWNLTILRLQGA